MLHANLITPEKFFLSTEAEMLVVPGQMGDMGIMEGHVPLVSLLRPGVIELHKPGNPPERIFVSGGYVETSGDTCTVLAEELAYVKELNRVTIQKDLEEAQGKFELNKEDSAAETTVMLCEAKLAALS